MSDTMTVKLNELATVVYAVAYVSLDYRTVTVYRDGRKLAERVLHPFAADSELCADAEIELRYLGWSVGTEWTRPSEEWTEFRADILGSATDVGSVPLSWITVPA